MDLSHIPPALLPAGFGPCEPDADQAALLAAELCRYPSAACWQHDPAQIGGKPRRAWWVRTVQVPGIPGTCRLRVVRHGRCSRRTPKPWEFTAKRLVASREEHFIHFPRFATGEEARNYADRWLAEQATATLLKSDGETCTNGELVNE